MTRAWCSAAIRCCRPRAGRRCARCSISSSATRPCASSAPLRARRPGPVVDLRLAPRLLGEVAQLRLRLRRHHAGGDDHLRRVLDVHVEEDDVAARQEADETRGRHDAGRHEHGQQIFLAAGHHGADLARGLAGDEDDRPQPLGGKLDQPDLLERLPRPGGADDGLEDLLQGAIDVAHDRHAADHLLAERDERAPEQVGGERADQRQRGDADDEAEARHGERQVGVRQIRRGHERLDPRVGDVDEPPREVERDGDGADDDEAGEEVVAQPRADVPSAARRILAHQPAQPGAQLGGRVIGAFARVGWAHRTSMVGRPAEQAPVGRSCRTFPRISAGRKGAASAITGYRRGRCRLWVDDQAVKAVRAQRHAQMLGLFGAGVGPEADAVEGAHAADNRFVDLRLATAQLLGMAADNKAG